MPGFPIRTSPDQRSVGSSPRLIAASHVLHRLLAPRHPPCALGNLATLKDARARYVVLKVPDPWSARPPARTNRVVWGAGGLRLPGVSGLGPVAPASDRPTAAGRSLKAQQCVRPRRPSIRRSSNRGEPRRYWAEAGRPDRVASDRHPRSSWACETVQLSWRPPRWRPRNAP